jgi:hydrogenase maturation protease
MRKQNLIYAIGNPAREDDGLGLEFLESLPDNEHWDKEYNYQLNIEDADLFSHYEKVLVVDAAFGQKRSYLLQEIEAAFSPEFTGHSLGLESVMALCQQIYNKQPLVRLLTLKGKSFNLKMGMTLQAQISLQESLAWFKKEIYLNPKSM